MLFPTHSFPGRQVGLEVKDVRPVELERKSLTVVDARVFPVRLGQSVGNVHGQTLR